MIRTVYMIVWCHIIWQEIQWIADGAARWEIALIKRIWLP